MGYWKSIQVNEEEHFARLDEERREDQDDWDRIFEAQVFQGQIDPTEEPDEPPEDHHADKSQPR